MAESAKYSLLCTLLYKYLDLKDEYLTVSLPRDANTNELFLIITLKLVTIYRYKTF